MSKRGHVLSVTSLLVWLSYGSRKLAARRERRKTPLFRMKRTMATENDAGKRTINDLRVIDLRSALEKRSLDKSGVKAVLLERLQKALEEDGVDPENFYSEVMKESTPSRKTKRTNKKLTRDDESETHSNVDDSLQNDLSLELDSDDERMDKGLEATDVVEDAINLSIEEEEKLLTEEDDGIAEREEKDEKAVEGKEKTTATSVAKSNSANGKPPVLVVTLSEQDSLELAASSTSPTMFNGDRQKTDDGHSGHGKDTSAAAASTSPSKSNADSVSEKTDKDGKDGGDAAGKGDKKGDGDADASPSGQKTPADASKCSAGSEKSSAGDGTAADGEGGSHVGEGGGGDGGGDKSQKESSSSTVATKVDKKEEGHNKEDTAPSGTTASGQSARANKSVATASKDAKGRVRVRPKKASTAINSKNLWVSGLSSSTRATDLKNLFSKYGKVIGAKIVTNARAPVSRYYGFVTMASSEEATKCIEHLHRIELHGRMISVEKAKNEPVSQQRAGAKVTAKKDTKSPSSAKVTTESPQQKETKVKETEVETVVADEAVASKDVKETEKHEEVAKKEEVVEKEEKEKTKEKEQKPEVEVSKETKSTPKASSLSSKSRSKSRDGHSKEMQSGNNFTYANVRRHTTYRGGYRLVRRAMITRRPFTYRPRNLLTFKKITAERIRQRQREEEREMREVERRRHQDFLRQKDIERKQRDEAMRLERERDRLRMEREKLEREKAEVLRHEREKQRMERERIEREREDLRRREFGGRYDDTRRPFKRPMEPRGPREEHWGNRNKRPNLGPNRFNVGGPPGGFHGNDRGGRPEPYERVKVERYDRRPMDEDRFHEPPARRTDMGRRDPPMHHDRDERRIIMRSEGVRDAGRFVRGGPPPMAGGGSGGSGGRDRDMPRDDRDRDRDRMGPPRGDIMHIRRPSPRTDWKQNSQDRSGSGRGHHNPPSTHDIGGRGDRDRYPEGGSKGMSGSSGYGGSSRSLGDNNRYGSSDRGGDSWHSGGPSSSSDHRSSSKQYSSSASSGGILGGGPSRESWGGDRKVEGGQSWGRSEGGQGDRWGSGGISGGMETRSIRSTQSASISQPVLPQTGSSMYGTTSGSDAGGMMMGMNSGGGSSYASGDRYDAYKGLSSMRRY